MLSVDFLIGFTIFILGLVWAATMVPGLLVGLDRSTAIDYDAVAYRTGVILVEDPGWGISPNNTQWEFKAKNDVYRMGLSIYREKPNILSEMKVQRFFNTSFWNYPDDYRDKVFFGDYPYLFNVSLVTNDGKYRSIGGPLPEGYGYIRRAIKLKGMSSAVVNFSNHPEYNASEDMNITQTANIGTFLVRMNCSQLLDRTVPQEYQIDPRTDLIWINLTHLELYMNNSITNPNNWTTNATLGQGIFGPVPRPASEQWTAARLQNVTFHLANATGAFPLPYGTAHPELWELVIDGTSLYDTLEPDADVQGNISLLLKPELFQPRNFPIDENSLVDVKFTFQNDPAGGHPVQTQIFYGPQPFGLNYTTAQPPRLMDGALEVAVW
ncbi:MAG: hypothetical protein LUQ40_04005 [Methanomicrobiales archaeon]|nr:hypothetical protein [Methanomicrobiales archaeon]